MISHTLPSSYVCDTLPAARLASGPEPSLSRSPSPSSAFEVTEVVEGNKMDEVEASEPLGSETSDDHSEAASSQPAARKLCVRHQRMADEGTNLKLQQVSYFCDM